MKFGVITFPGTWSDADCYYSLKEIMKQDVRYVWHKDTDLSDLDCVVLPGGFSYGDYLRAGAIARFSPVMAAVERFAASGKLVLGICNGFQILCEAGLLPGALMTNSHLEYRCQWVNLRTENSSSPFSNRCGVGQVVRIPISHHDGNYYADDGTVAALERQNRVIFRYCNAAGEPAPDANPNGSLHNIAGVINEGGNVLGMMPHPERACEEVLGGADGNLVWGSIVDFLRGRRG
ncbi:MAG: phosphoribosylformylglycinamidine synthase subunit PurQ [Chloroflexi bacterium]|nr:phosphoribosylformylglycinamidine synthase subunit PurQ [Chloroflexota bacterium]